MGNITAPIGRLTFPALPSLAKLRARKRMRSFAYGASQLALICASKHVATGAPYLCDDEGCPQFGTPHVCI